MKLQDIITRYRNEHKVSMETLGKASGLSKPYISMLEKGINPRSGKPVKPSIDTCYALAKGMGMSSKTFCLCWMRMQSWNWLQTLLKFLYLAV